MLSFGFRAKTKTGKTIIDRINAKSTEEAWQLLQQQGYQDIELFDNEISAIKLDDEISSRRLIFSAKEEQALRQQKSATSKLIWLLLRKNNMLIWLPLLILLVYGWTIQRDDYIQIAIESLIIYLLWFIWANIPGYLYNRALSASAWARWGEVEQLMRAIQRWQSWFKTPFPKHELLFRLATAEAGQGRLNEALRRVAVLENDASLAPGFYQTRLASLYFACHDYQQALECQQQALALNPSLSSKLDVALTLVRCLNSFSKAQALISDIDPQQIPEMAKLFYYYIQAVIAIENKQWLAACDYLECFFDYYKHYTGNPLLQVLGLSIRAYYALILAATGDIDSAKKHFAAALPLLQAHQDTALISRCETALQNPAFD